MKSLGVALLSSVLTAILVMFIIRDRVRVRPTAQTDILTVRELHVVDGTGAVRLTLGTHGRWSKQGNPALDLLPSGSGYGGAELLLDTDGRGTLWFDTKDTVGKMMVGHFVTGDSLPLSESDHSWGIRVINRTPVTGAPDSLYFAASEAGNVGVTGVSIKQGLPPDVKPVRLNAK
jgi:hypothetical protein